MAPTPAGSFEARHWTRQDDGRIRCDVCPRRCQLREGQPGLCFVRARHGDRLVLTTWGRSSGFCVDPIEKKPLHHFLPGTPVLSFGTAGCNLACRFCQNWDISKSREIQTLSDEASPEDIALAARELGCRSVAFTYNDPVVFLEYAIDVARVCRANDLRSVAVTAGYVCDAPRRELFGQVDAVNVDLKAFSDSFYARVCSGSLQPVLDTLLYVHRESRAWLEITTLLIPGENDSDEEIHAASRWLARKLGPDVPWHLSAFHPDYRMRNVPATPLATLQHARDIARSHGLRYVYTGNLRDPAGESTACPSCAATLIGRNRYAITSWGLDAAGRCRRCGDTCAGVFEAAAGRWGARRQPVRLGGSQRQAL